MILNLFLGSGLFLIKRVIFKNNLVKVGLGIDVGGGISFLVFKIMNDVYKIC